MRAAIIEKPGSLVVRDLPLPAVGAGEVLVRVQVCGICGTDVHIHKGEYLGTYPVVPGHELAGVVERTGEGAHRFRPGDRVAVEPNIACDNCPACLSNRQNFCESWRGVGVTLPGGMAEYLSVPERAVFAIGDLPLHAGAFVEPLSCVLHGVERADFRLGDRVLIVGAGPIGMLLSKTIQLRGGCEITQVERNRTRRVLAAESGAAHTVASLEELGTSRYDVVVDATGVPEVMERTLVYARKGGKVLLFGVPPRGATISLPAFTIFEHGLMILSSYTSVRNSLQAVRLLASGRIDVSGLVSHVLPLEELGRGIDLLNRGAEGVLKVMIEPARSGKG